MAISSYIGAPEDEPGYWDDKYPDDDEDDDPELERQAYEAFKERGWIIATTEAEVALAEARVADDYEPTPEELDEWYRSIAEPYGGAL
jgi:hypothetical protein